MFEGIQNETIESESLGPEKPSNQACEQSHETCYSNRFQHQTAITVKNFQ